MSDQHPVETILKVGAEGGGLTVHGISTSAGWKFRLNYNDSMPELIDQEAINESSNWSLDLASALATCRWPWNHLYPLYIHPHFADQIMAIKSGLDKKQRNRRPDRETWLLAKGPVDRNGKGQS